MITSQEINAMIAMQGQGVGYAGMPVAGPVPGASHYPPQFSYASPVMTGGAIGQAAAGGLMNSFGPTAGGLSSAAMNVTMAAGIGGWAANKLGAAGLGSTLSGIGNSRILGGLSNLNPMNAAFSGAFAAGETAVAAGGWGSLLTGAGLRSLATGAATGVLTSPAALIGLAAAPLAMGMHRGAQQYSQTAGMLGAYNTFANPFAATGRGFSDTQMSSMVSQMRSFQADSPFISMRDMQQSMARFNEMGMNQGERDAQEFSRKFTQMAKTVTAMSKAMGTTMDEASKVFAQMRSVGFYTGADVASNTLRTMTLRGQGISGATTLAAQSAGGGITRAGGLGTTPGAKAVGGVMSMFTGARGVGALSNEEMMNITGAASPDQAIAQLSTSVTGSLTNFYTQTGVGQAMLAALGSTDKSGAFTGELDSDMVEKLRTGQLNINNLVGTGRGKLTSRNAALSFKTKGQDVAGALLSQGDPTAAIGAIMQSVAGDKFSELDPENLISLLTERIQGLSRKEAEAMTKLYREGEKIRRESQQQLRAEMQAEIFMTDVKERHSFEGFKRRFMGGLADAFVPVNELGQRVSVGMGGFVQSTEDSMFGVTRVGSTSELRQQALDSLVGSAADISGMIGGERGFRDPELNRKALSGKATAGDFSGGMSANATKYVNALYDPRYLSGDKGDYLYQAYRDLSEGKVDQLDPHVMGAALRGGTSVEDYLLNLEVDTRQGNMRTDPVKVREILEKGGQEAEDMRQAIAYVAAQKGTQAAVMGTASLGRTGSSKDTLEARSAKIREIIGGGMRGGLMTTDEQDYATLMTGKNLAVVTELGKSNTSVGELRDMYDYALAQGVDPMEHLKKHRGISGLSAADISSFLSFAEGNSLNLSGEESKQISDLSFGSQQIMDLSNLAAIARASADTTTSDTAGAAKIKALAQQAGSGGVEGTRQAIEELLVELEGKGLTAGDLSSKEYGALTGSLGKALSTRRLVDSASDEERKKILSQFGFSEAAISRVDLSNTETVKELIGRGAVQGDAISSGGAFTETTQAEAVKYYKQLADSVGAISGQVLVMQERERAYQAEKRTAVPSPNAPPAKNPP